jgi:hypothetical protein
LFLLFLVAGAAAHCPPKPEKESPDFPFACSSAWNIQCHILGDVWGDIWDDHSNILWKGRKEGQNVNKCKL